MDETKLGFCSAPALDCSDSNSQALSQVLGAIGRRGSKELVCGRQDAGQGPGSATRDKPSWHESTLKKRHREHGAMPPLSSAV